MGEPAERREIMLVQLTVRELDERIEAAVMRALQSQAANAPAADPTRLLDTEQAAERLGITPGALRKLVSRKSIVPDLRGQRGNGLKGNRFSMRTIEAFITRNRRGQ